jgi:threonine dehydrogenase-like Zn-dependent dehydrogenase
MRATTIHAPGDIRVEDVPDPTIEAPTDAIVKVAAGCICGSDLWPYRGHNDITAGDTIGHECIGVVEEVGSEVTDFRAGDFVIVPFDHCDNTCVHCRAGAHSGCVNLGFTSSGQAEYTRVTQANGSLVKTDGLPDRSLYPSLLTLSDVMATGWHAAVSAGVTRGSTAVVAMSRHEPRQEIARRFGATEVVAERGKEGAERIAELTDGVGADAVLECVGTDESIKQAFSIARPGSTVGFVGVPHGVELPVRRMFQRNIGLAGGMAPVRKYLPELLELTLSGTIDPGLVFDMTLPLEQSPEGYRAMDERRAIKVLLEP